MGIDGWKLVRLGELVEILHGYAFKGEFFSDVSSNNILLTPGNFAIGGGFKSDKFKYYTGEIPEDYVLKEDDLLVTMTDLSKAADTLGYPAIIPKHSNQIRFLHNQRLGKVKIHCENQITKLFLYYILRTHSYRNEILASATGSTVKHTSPNRIKAFQFYLPPLSEQKEIAHILGILDDKIELNRQMNQTLEAMAKAIFKSWFVDFDPVKAKMEGRQPEGMDAATAELFPDSFEEFALGLIPRGWSIVQIQDIAKRIAMGPFGSRITTDNFVESGVPVIRGNNLVAGFNENNFVYLTEQKADELKSANAFRDDIIFTHRGTLGQVGIIPKVSNYSRYVISQSQMLLSVNESKVSSKLIYYFFQSLNGQRSLLQNTNTTGVPAIARPSSSLKTISLCIPSIKISHCFETIINNLDIKREQNINESRTLVNLRDSLLPKLTSGKIRIM
jgi:type I restriction enzyme S subunit